MEIRVILIERQKIIREGFKAFATNDDKVKIIGEAERLDAATAKLLAGCDVLVLEFYGAFNAFMAQVKEIKGKYPTLRIITLTGDEVDKLETLQKMLEGGISGYLTRDASKDELLHSVRKVCDEGYYVCTAFVMRMMKNPAYFRKKAHVIELKKPEQDVLNLVAEGLTNNDIAQRLFVSVRTVEARRKRLLDKTRATNTATLVRFAVEHGLLT